MSQFTSNFGHKIIDWKAPLWFQDDGDRAFLKRWDQRTVVEAMPCYDMDPSTPVNVVRERRTVVVVDDKAGNEYLYYEDGRPFDHSREIANIPFDQLQAEARREINRAQAKRRMQQIEDAAGDLYGLF